MDGWDGSMDGICKIIHDWMYGRDGKMDGWMG